MRPIKKVTATFRIVKELLEKMRANPNSTTLKAMRDAENNVNLEKVEKASDLMKLLV